MGFIYGDSRYLVIAPLYKKANHGMNQLPLTLWQKFLFRFRMMRKSSRRHMPPFSNLLNHF